MVMGFFKFLLGIPVGFPLDPFGAIPLLIGFIGKKFGFPPLPVFAANWPPFQSFTEELGLHWPN